MIFIAGQRNLDPLMYTATLDIVVLLQFLLGLGFILSNIFGWFLTTCLTLILTEHVLVFRRVDMRKYVINGGKQIGSLTRKSVFQMKKDKDIDYLIAKTDIGTVHRKTNSEIPKGYKTKCGAVFGDCR